MAGPESKIQKSILDWLALYPKKVKAQRINSGAIRTKGGGFVRLAATGTPDIVGCLEDGRHLAIEVKRPGNRPTELQWDYILMTQRAGGVAFWTDSLAECELIMGKVFNGKWVATVNGRQIITDEFVTAHDEPNPETVRRELRELRKRKRLANARGKA